MTSAPFAGRVALVTGGGTGIGAAISSLLGERGAAVVICQPDQESAERLAAELAAGGRDIVGIGADLSQPEACTELVQRSLAARGRIDILVNNAAVVGPPARGELLEFPDDQLDLIVDVNLKATFRCSREVARHLRDEGRGGVIVNIASVGAFAAQEKASAYVATKAGVAGLTRAMAFELGGLGIRVVAVAPGDIDLANDGAMPPENPYDTMPGEWWARRAVLHRRGAPSDIAAAVCFLASDEADYVTGSTLVVDGGWLSY
jgi:NAD(P)-dependent dehydrogenase (short-subunit alcohol dehydrogenase family)